MTSSFCSDFIAWRRAAFRSASRFGACRPSRLLAQGTLASLLVGLLGVMPLTALAAVPTPVDYLREVRPILANHCFKCHGPDEEARKAKLRLDERESALKPAKSGEVAIVPGQPDRSELLRRVFTGNEEDLMPNIS